MRLTDRPDNMLVYKGLKLKLNLAYDHVLRVQELNKDDNFNDVERVDIMCEMFVRNYKDIESLDINSKAEIINAIFENFINGDSKEGEAEPVFDFDQDADYIYASFLYDYNIDLVEQQGQLSWDKFIALLSSLSDNTKFKQVIKIRTMKLPKKTKHNKEERAELLRLKRLYALDQKQSREEQIKALDDKISAFAGKMKTRKVKGGKKNVRRKNHD